jgi:pimeloyl-ACP methyl ester carboxylesterase
MLNLVFTHSLGLTAQAQWGPQLGAFAALGRVTTVDLPGHGGQRLSSTHEHHLQGASRLIDAAIAGPDPAVLIGSNYGGMVAAAYAASRPGVIKALVLVNGRARVGATARDTMLARAAELRGQGGMRRLADQVIGRWFTEDFAHENPGYVKALQSVLADQDSAGYAEATRWVASADLREDFTRIDAPALAVTSRADSSFADGGLADVLERLPDVWLRPIPGAHLAAQESPADFYAAVASFLRGLSGWAE